MSSEPTIGGTVESGGFTVTSTHETAEQMTAGLSEPAESASEGESDTSKAGQVLGKRSAEAKEAKKAVRSMGDEADVEGGGVGGAAEEKAAGTDEKPADKPLGKPRHDPIARMQEATRQAAEAKRERDGERQRREAAERRLEELERVQKPSQPTQEQRPEPKDGKPVMADFDTHEEYLDARDQWNQRTWAREHEQRTQDQARQQRVHSYVGKFSQSVTEYAKANPDFRTQVSEEIVNLQPSLTLDGSRPPDGGTWIADELLDNAEHAPALMLHLSEHDEDFQRIRALRTPKAVTREIDRLVTRLEAATTAPDSRPTVSRAKPPVRAVTGSPAAAGEPDPDRGSFEEHLAFYNARGRRR